MISDDERAELVRLTKRARVNRHVAFRARIVLACADVSSNVEVARLLRVSAKTVGMWRRRFVEFRVDALYDEPRVPQLRDAILAYVDAHNEEAKPFKWTKTADEILEKVRRFGLRTQQVHEE